MSTLPKPNIKKPKTLNPRARFSNFQIISFIAVFAVIGSVFLYRSFAATNNTPILTYDYVAQPYTDDGGGQCHQSVWALGKSPTTPYVSPDSYKQQQRYILANPNATDSAGNRGSDEWWFMFNHYFDSSYNISRAGYSNSFFNLHNVAGDNGPSGGVGWGFGSGVSSYHLFNDGVNDPDGTLILLENDIAHNKTKIPTPSVNQWHSYVVHIVFGRTDGTTPRAGMSEVWMDGNKVADVRNVNTLQRAKGPDGNYYTQQWLQLWQGTYTSGAPCQPANTSAVSGKLTLARIGKTSSEAINDVPQYSGTLATSHIAGQPNYGDGSLKLSSTQLTVGDLILPAELGGSGSVPVPAPTPAPTPAPSSVPTRAETLTSSINNGDTVANGTSWTVSVTPSPSSVEFWANGTKLATDTSAPFSTVINLPTGTNKLGLCYTINATRTCNGVGGIFATITVTAAASTPAPAPTPTPTSPPPPTTTSFTSSINNGATVTNGSTWTVSFGINPSLVEFWANGTKLTSDTSAPYSTVINLPTGKNQLGLCYTLNSVRTCNGTGGIFATIYIVEAPQAKITAQPSASVSDTTKPSTPKNFRVTATSKTQLSLAWDASTDNVNVVGYKLTRSLQQIYDGPKLAVTNYDLNASSKYSYYVNAYDAAGNVSAPSQRICVGKWSWWSSVTRSRSWKYC